MQKYNKGNLITAHQWASSTAQSLALDHACRSPRDYTIRDMCCQQVQMCIFYNSIITVYVMQI